MEQTINGYHIFQLQAKEPKETIAFSSVENDLGDGFGDSRLFGLKTGFREFALDFPVLQNYESSRTVELGGVLHTPAEYLWELFCEQQATGKPFVIQSPRDNQNYLCKFKDSNLTEKGIVRNLFTGGAMFRQVRKTGVTVFDVSLMNGIFAEYDFGLIKESDGGFAPSVLDSSGNGRDATMLGDIGAIPPIYKTDQLNGRGVSRFTNAAGAETYPLFWEGSFTFYWALMVARFDGATFPTYSGALSALTSNTIFVGNSGNDKWFDQSYSNVYYSKNGAQSAQTAMPAPVSNAFSISFIQVLGGVPVDGIQIGRDRDFGAARTWKGDIAHIIVGNQPLKRSGLNSLLEHVSTLWGIGVN
jgi:hypothetical protein